MNKYSKEDWIHRYQFFKDLIFFVENIMEIFAKMNDSKHVIHNGDQLYSDIYSKEYGNG